jgi:branched-chain amino acid transport system permease protein
MTSKLAFGIAALALAVLVPTIMSNEYYVNVSSQVIIYALLALSLNILVGYGGMTSLGHAAYLGIAAYASVWLTTVAGWHPAAAATAALAIGTLSAAFFGALALRVSGLSFMMITLAFGQIVWGIAYRWVSITNGDNGLKLPVRPTVFGYSISSSANFYYFALTVFLVAIYAIWRLSDSSFGAVLRGMRDQPRRMRMLGHNVLMVRWIAFTLAGFWGSVAGLLYVYYNQFVSPHAVSLQQSAEALLMVILGGVNTIAGPILGAIVITLVKIILSSYLDRWYTVLGVIFIVAVIYMPDGLVPGAVKLFRGKQIFRGESLRSLVSK